MFRKLIFAILVLFAGASFLSAQQKNLPSARVQGAELQPVTITAGSITAFAGDTVSVPITLKNFENLGAITITLVYNAAVLNYVGTENWSSLTPGALAGENNGKIVLAWDNAFGITDTSQKLVDLRFVLGGEYSAITFLPEETELTDVDGVPFVLQFVNGSVGVLTGFNLSGTVKYRNSASTPLTGAIIDLKQSGSVIDWKVANNTGAFIFTGVLPGVYTLAARHSLPWAGVNATDALLIRRYVVGFQAFDSLQVKASDVNRTTTVNATDALLVRRRVVGFDTTFVRGNWTFEVPADTITNSNIVRNILGLCTGDVNGSNVPGVLKSTPTVSSITEGRIEIQDGNNFLIPIRISSREAVGAVTLMFEYPVESFDIKGITSKMEGLLYSAKDGILTVAWDDIAGASFSENEPLLTILASVKDGNGSGLKLNLLPEFSEFADINANVLPAVTVTMPELGLSLPTEFSLSQNFPNPFNPATTIEYDVAYEGKIHIEIYNTLGEVVEVLADAVQAPGRYSVQWNAKNFTSGVYFYRMTAENSTKNFTQVKKLMLVK